MKIVTFNEFDESLIDSKHTVEHYNSGSDGDAVVAIIDINTIFDFEENKSNACEDKFVSVAIIEEDSDYDAFKNFGIDAWIKANDLGEINGLLNLIEKKVFLIIIDTHCHLDNKQYYEDVDIVIQRALESGVKGFLIPGADFEDLPQAIKLAEKYDEVFFAVGIHPYDMEQYDESIMEKYINHPKCIAVGECGLDYYRLPDDEEERKQNIAKQKEVFISQVEFAKRVKKPLIIHIREASDDSRQILIDYNAKEVGGVLHCYNASEHLLPLAEHNFYFGIGGVITFKNAKKLVEVLPKIPQDRLLLETDGPYLTPDPFRGKRNEPAYTNYVANKISDLLEITKEDLEKITTTNTLTLFKQFSTII